MSLSVFKSFIEKIDTPFIDHIDGKKIKDISNEVTGLFTYNKEWVCKDSRGTQREILTRINNKTLIMIRYMLNYLGKFNTKTHHLTEDEMRFALSFRVAYYNDEFNAISNFVKGIGGTVSKSFSDQFNNHTNAFRKSLLSPFDPTIDSEHPKKPIPSSVTKFLETGKPYHTFGEKDCFVEPIPKYNKPTLHIQTVSLIKESSFNNVCLVIRPTIRFDNLNRSFFKYSLP